MSLPPRLKELDRLLASLGEDAEPMLLSELDGFFAAIILSPDRISSAEWLRKVWGADGENDAAPAFADMVGMQHFIDLVMAHYNGISSDLRRGTYGPIFDVDERHNEVLWELWIEGFERGRRLRPGGWLRIAASPDKSAVEALAGLVMLWRVAERESDIPQSEIDRLTAEAPELIPMWVERLDLARRLADGATLTAPAPVSKTGRNETCPCGSGKKYKRCCGLN